MEFSRPSKFYVSVSLQRNVTCVLLTNKFAEMINCEDDVADFFIIVLRGWYYKRYAMSFKFTLELR